MVKNFLNGEKLIIEISNKTIPINFHNSYAEGREDEVFLIIGSLNYLEIACNKSSVDEKLNISYGEKFKIKIWK